MLQRLILQVGTAQLCRTTLIQQLHGALCLNVPTRVHGERRFTV
jgi:hypothetical protein